MTDREQALVAARAFLEECRKRRDSSVNADFYWRLFGWAQAARRRAVCEPVQRGLFV